MLFYLRMYVFYLRMYVFYILAITYSKYIFHVKIQLFVTYSKSLTRIRIRLDPHWFGFLDPDPYPDPH
jgi:hypothetical protein